MIRRYDNRCDSWVDRSAKLSGSRRNSGSTRSVAGLSAFDYRICAVVSAKLIGLNVRGLGCASALEGRLAGSH